MVCFFYTKKTQRGWSQMTKAEREALKAEFIAGDYRTIKEFAEEKGIAYTGNFRKSTPLEHEKSTSPFG